MWFYKGQGNRQWKVLVQVNHELGPRHPILQCRAQKSDRELGVYSRGSLKFVAYRGSIKHSWSYCVATDFMRPTQRGVGAVHGWNRNNRLVFNNSIIKGGKDKVL